MNVEKLRKMNVLASTLKEQGLAASSEDAASLANSMTPGKQEDGFERIFAQPEHNAVLDNDSEEHKEEEKTTFSEEQVKSILQSFSDQFCAEIDKLTEKHARLEEAIAKLKQERVSPSGQDISEQELKEELDEGSDVVLEPKQEIQEQPEPVKTESPINAEPQKPKEEHQTSPRSGGYDSDDVSIEKIFYYGQK